MVAGNDKTKSRPLPTREMRQSLCVCGSMTAAIEPSFLIYRRCTAVCGPLGRQWRGHLGGQAPAHIPRWLLMRVLAYRLQSDAFGDLDNSIRRILRSGKEDGVGAPFDRRAPQTREGLGLKAGALLVREWKGRLERVMILEEGFAWNGQTFGSLSQIAKAITGTTWNGHRFFGLRQG